MKRTFSNRELVPAFQLYEAAWTEAAATDDLTEKRRAHVFRAWLLLRVVHQTPMRGRTHVTSNRLCAIRGSLRAAASLRRQETASRYTALPFCKLPRSR